MVAAPPRTWRKMPQGERSLDRGQPSAPTGRGKDGTHRMHETQAQAPLVQGGKLRPRTRQPVHPGQRDPGGLVSIPLYLALELPSGANILLGRQEGAGVTCEQATDPLPVVCEVGEGGAVRIKRDDVCKALAPMGSGPLRKSRLSGLPLV